MVEPTGTRICPKFVSRDYIEAAYVWSRGRFVGAYSRPTPQLLKTLEAATRQFLWKGGLTTGATAQSSALIHGIRPYALYHLSKIPRGNGWMTSLVEWIYYRIYYRI